MLDEVVCTLARFLQPLWSRVLGHAQQDLRQIDFLGIGGDARLVGDEVVELALGNLEPPIDFPLAQPVEQDVLPDVFTELGKRDALGFEPLAHRRHGHVVRFRDPAHGGVDRRVVNPHAALARELQLSAVDDHAFQDLPLQDIRWRELDLLPLQLGHGRQCAGTQLVGRDHFVIDDSDYAIDRSR